MNEKSGSQIYREYQHRLIGERYLRLKNFGERLVPLEKAIAEIYQDSIVIIKARPEKIVIEIY